MTLPLEYEKEAAAFPPILRALLEAELAAGNEIAELGHSFPAPPVGAYFKLARPVTTRPRESGGGIDFYDRNGSTYSGEFTDQRRFFFILEPPAPPPPEPGMDAIRASNAATPDAVARFERSMEIDYEKWREGIGYDIELLRSATQAERDRIEQVLLSRGAQDWRDVEALAACDTPRTRSMLRAAMASPNAEIRMAVVRHAPDLVAPAGMTESLVLALETGQFYGGLSQALDQAATHHPPDVIQALMRGTLEREGEVAVHFAALLMFIHGKAKERFDWAHRPFFLRFNTTDRKEREAAFRELRERIGLT